MKTMFLLPVLLAILLVVTGAAFAGPCCQDECYKVTGTDLNDSNSFTQHWSFCHAGGTLVCNGLTQILIAVFFNQGLIEQATGLCPDSLCTPGAGAYMRFHGDDNDIFNGLYYDGTNQFSIHGVAEECP